MTGVQTCALPICRVQLEEAEAEALAALCAGSIGRGLGLADGGGLALYRSLLEMLSQAPRIDVGRLHGLADRLARTDAEDAYRATEELLSRFLARMAAGAARRDLVRDQIPDQIADRDIVAGEGAAMQALAARADPARWAELRGEIERSFATARELNLDRKQAVLGAFFAIEETAR